MSASGAGGASVAPPVVGVDFGGTWIRAALADGSGGLTARREARTPAREGVEAVVESIIRAVEEVGAPFAAVGVCSPGPLDARTGVVYSPSNLLGWRDVPLAAMLERRLGVPVVLGNDANAAALGEHAYGAGRGFSDVIYVTVSTGVGGGIIAGGRLLEGRRGAAGEVGHIVLQPDGSPCGCGNRGCLETLASGTAIARQARDAIAAGWNTEIAGLAGPEGVSAEVVVRAAVAGDGLAREIVRRAGRWLGLGLAGLVHLYDPEVLIVGGGVTGAGDLLMDPAREILLANVMPIYREDLRVVRPDLGTDAGLYGAVALARELVS